MKTENIRKRGHRALYLALCIALSLSLCVGFFAVTGAAAQSKITYHGQKVILGGVPFGVKFNTEGVTVIGFSDIDSTPKAQTPAYLAGLRTKDVITKINGKVIKNAAELTASVEACGGAPISLTYKRAGIEKTVTITPAYSKNEARYKTGVWVKDSGAGIGTVTYIMPDTHSFGGLGHGICDNDTGELIAISRGTVMDVNISAVKKGVSGTPGEIKGYFGTTTLGSMAKNTDCGVFGKLDCLPAYCDKTIDVAMRDEIREGEAQIRCTLGDGAPQSYTIEIISVNKHAEGSKCFVIHVTDQKLIEKTGGIVQGMSGSPIIQGGKLIGAVTHVMVNDPTTGYGIFIENMLNAAQSQAMPKAA
jgi:stage IV sporulation protein B